MLTVFSLQTCARASLSLLPLPFLVRAVMSASFIQGAASKSLAVASVREAVRVKSSNSLVASARPLRRGGGGEREGGGWMMMRVGASSRCRLLSPPPPTRPIPAPGPIAHSPPLPPPSTAQSSGACAVAAERGERGRRGPLPERATSARMLTGMKLQNKPFHLRAPRRPHHDAHSRRLLGCPPRRVPFHASGVGARRKGGRDGGARRQKGRELPFRSQLARSNSRLVCVSLSCTHKAHRTEVLAPPSVLSRARPLVMTVAIVFVGKGFWWWEERREGRRWRS